MTEATTTEVGEVYVEEPMPLRRGHGCVDEKCCDEDADDCDDCCDGCSCCAEEYAPKRQMPGRYEMADLAYQIACEAHERQLCALEDAAAINGEVAIRALELAAGLQGYIA